ncbi:MAG: Sapep family Mn(2+)-dependent dipeptidase, partial [Erysipelotrichaceae bacterium]|nr:Sapep family Mn(2+)-dependent dipeptidase [Erysipelotrichaceae bacterium]
MKDYIKIIEDNKEEMLQTLADLVAIPSVVSEAEGDMPFGKEVHRAYEYMMAKAEADGFITKNVDNQGGHIDFPGKTDDLVAVVGHLDVVPAGDTANWNTDPFKAEIIDGKMYGRGTIDDKGPLLAGYYAVKALKEAGFEPEKTIRVMLGLDEETNWYGMEYYMEREKAPVAGFSPDAEFPVIHGEKGMISFDLTKKIDLSSEDGIRLISLKGGTVSNAVPDSAKAVIAYGSKTSEITAKGVSAHASTPEQGTNAISVLFDLLAEKKFAQKDVNDIISFYKDHLGFDIHGERMEIGFEDEPSGKLTLNVGIVDIENDTAKLVIDVRYPVTYTLKQVMEGVHKVCDPFGWEITENTGAGPLYKPADDPLVVTLMDIYRKYTGQHDAQPITMGGATYARAVPNTVAFGPLFPGEADLCHQPN